MPTPVLHALKVLFIVVVYLYLWYVAKAVRVHLGSGADRRETHEITVVRSPSNQHLTFSVTGALIVGRSAEADVTVDDPYASDFHARLGPHTGGVRLHDLDSTNGTFVNGTKIAAPTVLRRGDSMQVGETVMEVK
jgi:hypothetical protein